MLFITLLAYYKLIPNDTILGLHLNFKANTLWKVEQNFRFKANIQNICAKYFSPKKIILPQPSPLGNMVLAHSSTLANLC